MSAWTAVLFCDGEPVSDPIPCEDWDAAAVFAPLVAGWLGGPVSIVRAVVASRPSVVDPQPSLFEEAS